MSAAAPGERARCRRLDRVAGGIRAGRFPCARGALGGNERPLGGRVLLVTDPPPNVLAGYESVHPGFADGIVKMAEQAARHHQELEQ